MTRQWPSRISRLCKSVHTESNISDCIIYSLTHIHFKMFKDGARGCLPSYSSTCSPLFQTHSFSHLITNFERLFSFLGGGGRVVVVVVEGISEEVQVFPVPKAGGVTETFIVGSQRREEEM